jgi:hypothetical protein
MKCIKAIRKTKDAEIGQIKRVDDKTAYNMVGSSWMYVPKSEWKSGLNKVKNKEKDIESVNNNSRKK